MKHIYAGMMCLCAAAVFAEVHTFTLGDGRTVAAEVIEYNDSLKRVKLRREDGKEVMVSPAVFAEADQEYIRSWVAANAFVSDRILKVECDDREVKDWKEEEMKDVRTSGGVEKDFVHNVIEYEEAVFDFELENKAAIPLKDLVLEYCIYYEQSAMANKKKPEPVMKTKYGKIDVPVLKDGEPVTLSTEPVMIYEDNINPMPSSGQQGDQRQPGEGDIIGVRARLTSKNSDVIREISSSSSMKEEKYPWTTKSSPNKR